MKKLNEEEKGYIEGFIGRKDLRTPPTIETPVEGVEDYYYSEQSARHWSNLNHWVKKEYMLVKKKVNGILYTERVAHGRKPTCKVTDAVLVASGIEGKDLMVEYTNVAW